MNILRETSPVLIIIDQKLENVEYLKYVSSMIKNYARCTREIKDGIATEIAALNGKKKTLFCQQIGLKFKEETS
jgi:hypothetical protein